MSQFTLQWSIQSGDAGKNVKQFLQEKHISKAALTDIKFAGGSIAVNGDEVTVRRQLHVGEILTVLFPPEAKSDGMIAEHIPLQILYEDEYVLVINKEAGMSTIPSREHPTGSLANAILGYYETLGLASTVHVVTRLDRDTSGVVLVAKHRHIHHLLSKQQIDGLISREYVAFSEGFYSKKIGTIIAPIARKKDSIIEREVNADGKYACTHYEVLTQYEGYAHVKLKLETGRTHQIRVHLSSIGHPLMGDDLYGGSLHLLRRQALHCRSLGFYHPYLQKTIRIEAQLPSDLKALIINPVS